MLMLHMCRKAFYFVGIVNDMLEYIILIVKIHGSTLYLKKPVGGTLGRWWSINIWWRHQMETFSASLALCEGNPPVTGGSPNKIQWRGALMLSLICTWINGWVNNREADDLRCYRAHCDITSCKTPEGFPTHLCVTRLNDNLQFRIFL